ncbi:MAG TPA: lysylphosphatidylglycerol synthase domain-containing protein [Pedococcus sp.]
MNHTGTGYVFLVWAHDEGVGMSVSGRGAATGRTGRRSTGRSPMWLRPVLGTAVLALLVWRLGWGPFVEAVRGVEPSSLVAAAAIAAVTTVCCAWRWSVVARTLGVVVPLSSAVSACYRSQFVNVATPGGVVGDLLRGVGTGRATGDTLLGVRSVVWERFVGQAVQVLLALVALVVLPSPIPRGVVWGVVAVVAGTVVVLARTHSRLVGEGRLLLAPAVWPRLAVASTVVVGGHVATFLVATRSAGLTAPTLRVLPVTLLVLVSAGLPLNVAGWGPREGAAAWAFGAAGLGAGLGVSTAVVFGVLAVVSSLPGAALVVWGAMRRRTSGKVGATVPARSTRPPLEAAARGAALAGSPARG